MVKKGKNVYQSDTLMKDFWRNSERFIDVCQGLLFHGQQKIDKVMELDCEQATTVQKESIQRRRDLLKMINVEGQDVIIGIENQQAKDKTMPFRDLEYTSLKYSIRLKDRKNEICPIITMIMYYGCTKWNCKKELKDMMHIPDSLKEYVNNWKSMIIDVKEVDSSIFKHKEVRDFFEGVQRLYGWDKDINSLKGITLTYETAIAIGVVTGTQALIDKAEKEEGGMVDMCQAVDEALQECKAKAIEEGKAQGLAQGLAEGKVQGLKEGTKQTVIQLLTKKLGNLSDQMIERIKESSSQKIDLLVISIFDIENEQDVLNIIH